MNYEDYEVIYEGDGCWDDAYNINCSSPEAAAEYTAQWFWESCGGSSWMLELKGVPFLVRSLEKPLEVHEVSVFMDFSPTFFGTIV